MSANNKILINKKDFKVYHIDVDRGLKKDNLIGQGKTLKGALKVYEKWLKEQEEDFGWFPIEYGIGFF